MPASGSLRNLLLIAVSSTALASGTTAVSAAAAIAPIDKITPVTDEMLLNPPESDWLMWRRTLDGYGFSPLDQINKENVKDLRAAWAWSMTPGRTEATPLVHDGILYIFSYGNKVQALDGATGDLIWEYTHTLEEELSQAGGDQSIRSMGVYGNNLIVPTTDAHILALDLKTGQLVWDHQTAEWRTGWRYSSGPTIVDGKIIQGMTGCGNGQPGGCFVTAHDANTGEELWRFYTIARPDTPEGETWNGLPLKSRFGGSAWIAGSYDPEQKLIFMGVGQPYPWIAEINGLLPPSTEPGVSNEALFTNTTLALDIETGEPRWHYQHLKTDTLDLDHVFERMLIDLPVDGEMRKTVVSTGKIGIIEALDRTSGEWLWGKETVPQNIVLAIDPETGDKTMNPEALPHIGQTTMNCPADPGGRGWPATAYNPETHILYLPLAEFCSDTTPQPLDQGQVYTRGGRATFVRVPVPDSDGNIGRIDAIDLTDQSTVWSYRQRPPIMSSVLPTAGGLVFAGGYDRKFYAFDDRTGEILWSSKLSNAVNSFPISYMAGGKQYVAVVATDDSAVARGWGSLTPEFRTPPDHGASLWVFALE